MNDSKWCLRLVPPSLLIGIQSDSAFWFVVDPTGPTSHAAVYGLSASRVDRSKCLCLIELLEAAIAGVANFNRQDMPTNIAVQRGMQSRFAPRGRYSWQEGVLPQFNSWLVDRYESHASQ